MFLHFISHIRETNTNSFRVKHKYFVSFRLINVRRTLHVPLENIQNFKVAFVTTWQKALWHMIRFRIGDELHAIIRAHWICMLLIKHTWHAIKFDTIDAIDFRCS